MGHFDICFNEVRDISKAVSNLMLVNKSIDTYGVTPQLRDLVGDSFQRSGIALSTE